MPMTQFNNDILLTHLYPTDKTNELMRSKYPDHIEVITAKNGKQNFCVKATNEEMYMDIVNIWERMVCEYIKGDTPCLFYLDCDLKSSRPYGVTYNGQNDTAKSTIDKEIKKNSFLSQYKYTYKVRETRKINDTQYKHSYHIIFNDLPVENNAVILEYLKSIGYDDKVEGKDIWDFKVYDAGRKMSALYCTKSADIPIFEPMPYAKENLKINDYFITNVGKDATIIKLPNQVEKKKEEKKEEYNRDTKKNTSADTKKDKNNTNAIENKIKGIVEHLAVVRSDDYDGWTEVMWALIGICKKQELRRRFCEDMVHLFSKKSTKYDVNETDDKFEKAWNEDRDETVGWPRLMKCLKEDDIDYYEKINTPTYTAYKTEFELNNCKILNPPSVAIIDREGSMILSSIKDAKLRYEHVNVIVKNKKDEWEKKGFIDLWVKDSSLRKYDKMVFNPPPLLCKSYDFNLWEGFKIKDVVTQNTERNYYEEYVNYAKVLFGDEKVAMFILARYAYRLQNPAYRTQLCLIIYGDEGDGKNMFLSPIYKIFGKYALQLDSGEKLYDKHCELENMKLLILVNEAGGDTNFKNADILKSRITDPELWINPKNMKSYCVENRVDYDMATNHRNVVKLTHSSHRRYLQVETTQVMSGNTDFFNDFLENIVNNEIALKQIYDGLMLLDVKNYVPSGNFQTDKPHTNIMDEVKEQNKDKVMCFIEDVVRAYTGSVNEVHYFNNEMFDLWNRWLFDNKVKLELNNRQFGIRFGDMCKKFINKNDVLIKRDAKKSLNTFKMNDLKKLFDIE
jgi:hypothetical protein